MTQSFKQKLSHYLLSHLDACKTSLRQLISHPFLTLFTLITISLSLTLPLGFYSFFKPIQHLSANWDEGAQMTVYLKKAEAPSDVAEIIKQAKDTPFVLDAQFLSANDVLKDFQKNAKVDEVLALLPQNPLPSLIEITLDQDKISKPDVLALQNALSKNPKVDKIVLDYEWLEKLNAFVAFGKSLTQLIALLIGLGVIFLISNTLRLALERHKEEIEVFAEMGATKSYICRPFLYRGTLYGLFGGLIAIGILDLLTALLKSPTQKIASLYQSVFSLSYLSICDSLLVISFSALLGWLGAKFAFSLLQYRLFPK